MRRQKDQNILTTFWLLVGAYDTQRWEWRGLTDTNINCLLLSSYPLSPTSLYGGWKPWINVFMSHSYTERKNLFCLSHLFYECSQWIGPGLWFFPTKQAVSPPLCRKHKKLLKVAAFSILFGTLCWATSVFAFLLGIAVVCIHCVLGFRVPWHSPIFLHSLLSCSACKMDPNSHKVALRSTNPYFGKRRGWGHNTDLWSISQLVLQYYYKNQS